MLSKVLRQVCELELITLDAELIPFDSPCTYGGRHRSQWRPVHTCTAAAAGTRAARQLRELHRVRQRSPRLCRRVEHPGTQQPGAAAARREIREDPAAEY